MIGALLEAMVEAGIIAKNYGFLVRTRGTSPQLHAHIGGRTRRRRPNLWPYGWSILVIGLDIKQARTFID